MDRRSFLVGAATGALALGTRPADAQDANSQTMGPMDASGHRPVRRPPKPGALPSVSIEERDALERQLACQCPCTLDVFTCRTTDFSCTYSPKLHREVLALHDGGKSAEEILDAFVANYGEKALMAPKPQGFNLWGYLLPGVVVGIAAVALAAVLRRRETVAAAASREGQPVSPVSASAEELERLNQALEEVRD